MMPAELKFKKTDMVRFQVEPSKAGIVMYDTMNARMKRIYGVRYLNVSSGKFETQEFEEYELLTTLEGRRILEG